jgi:hypothetical protein
MKPAEKILRLQSYIAAQRQRLSMPISQRHSQHLHELKEWLKIDILKHENALKRLVGP